MPATKKTGQELLIHIADRFIAVTQDLQFHCYCLECDRCKEMTALIKQRIKEYDDLPKDLGHEAATTTDALTGAKK